MIETTKPPAVPTKKPKQATKLYWMGALPKAGVFKYKRPSLEQTAILNTNTCEEFCLLEDATAQKLWDRWEVWSGKCKYAQNITVHGHEFVAFSCRPVMQKGDNNGQTTMIFDPWPGSVVKMTSEKLASIIDATQKTFQREENGKDAEKNTALTTRFLNHDLTNSRNSIIDRTGKNPRLTDCRTDYTEFDEEKDTPCTEFVYIVELKDADPKTKPEDYWTLPRITMEQFFANPPKSLADALKAGELS
jgi:hypothetical protein